MNLKVLCKNLFNIWDIVVVYQDIEDLPKVLTFGKVLSIEGGLTEVYVESDNFVTGFPIYITKFSNMLKVETED